MTRAPIAITCGEPAGIGPEIIVKARAGLGAALPCFAIGDPEHFARLGAKLALISNPAEAASIAPDQLPLLPHALPGALTMGHANPAHASGVIEVIARGVELVQSGAASALCTAPIHKKALKDGAGFAFPGHTEYLAHLAGDLPVVMMLACEALKVVPATIHIALAEVPEALTPAGLEEVIRITHAALIRDFGLATPRIAIAGLNPHAGEGGAMGREELEWIAPLVARLGAEGLALSGPHPADTMFHAGARARYDAAIAMYHDQALIPIKTLDFSGGVNVTLGLPFIRTSPDHGTAFDIAGKDRADPSSMMAALKLAAYMAEARDGRD